MDMLMKTVIVCFLFMEIKEDDLFECFKCTNEKLIE